MRGLVTGFDAFGRLETNPSSALARSLAEADSALDALTLPTSFKRGWLALDQAIRNGKYGFVVLFGYARSVNGLRLERRATNHSREKAKDNDGQRTNKVIVQGSPKHLETIVEVEKLRAAVQETTQCPVELSSDAGGYVCNHTYYQVLHKYRKLPCVFIHLSAKEESSDFFLVEQAATALVSVMKDSVSA